ncbi:MAG: sulfite exporter TauE/SafE family protein [Armatimonadota bacterium]
MGDLTLVRTLGHRTVYILLGLGVSAGLLGGLLGIGGGAIIVPGLVFFLNFDQHRAHGTSLAVVLAMSLASVAAYWRGGHIDWLLAVEMAFGGVLGACVGARVVAALNGPVLRWIFALFLVSVGVRMIVAGLLGPKGAPQAQHALSGMNLAAHVLLAVGLGVVTGFLSSLLGIGGGMVMVPAMVLVLGVDQHTAQGVSLAAIMPTALTGAFLHLNMGNVEIRVAKWVGTGALIGGATGASVATLLCPATLKLFFGVFLVVMAVLMALKRQGSRPGECEVA